MFEYLIIGAFILTGSHFVRSGIQAMQGKPLAKPLLLARLLFHKVESFERDLIQKTFPEERAKTIKVLGIIRIAFGLALVSVGVNSLMQILP